MWSSAGCITTMCGFEFSVQTGRESRKSAHNDRAVMVLANVVRLAVEVEEQA